MCSEWNGVVDVRGHRTMNLLVPVVSTELWASCEQLRHHMLDILLPYILRDVWQSEIPPNYHVIPALEIVISSVFFFAFSALHIKNHATYFHQRIFYELMTNYIWKHNFFFKKISMLPSCRVILPHPSRNIVMRVILNLFCV